jgi:asparagine synthase (glutamine-hydrolysing)
MSALGGLFSRCGAPIPRDLLGKLSNHLEVMGPDGEHIFFAPAAAFLYRPFHTRAESLALQPLQSRSGLVLILDGRLDNGGDLNRTLGLTFPNVPPATEIVLAAYERWGLEAFQHLIGDFALALWDANLQRLVLAVDSVGLRPLFYTLDDNFLVWASRARALHTCYRPGAKLNDDFFAAFLTNNPSAHSPFVGIEAVPAAHVLVVDARSAMLRRYWSFDPGASLSYTRDEDYEDHFREVFATAVECRLTSQGSVFAELSGGLDSSSIVAVADQLMARKPSLTTALHTVSFTFDGSASSDERCYIHAMEEQRRRSGLHISEQSHPILVQPLESCVPDAPTNQLCFVARQDFLAARMAELGSRVLLSGLAGDALFWGELPTPPLYLADLVCNGRFDELGREARALSRETREPLLKLLWQGAFAPSFRGRAHRSTFAPQTGLWLHQNFVRRTGLEERRFGMPDDLGFPLPSQSLQYSLIRQSVRIYALERCLSHGYLEMRYPFLDRRLLAFALALPTDQKIRLAETRSIVRRALIGVLPEAIRQRRDKAGPAEAFLRALNPAWGWISRLLPDLRCVDLGFIDGDRFRASLNLARHGLINNLVQLMRTIALELWLRSLERDSTVATAEGRRSTSLPGRQHLSIQKGQRHERFNPRHPVQAQL